MWIRRGLLVSLCVAALLLTTEVLMGQEAGSTTATVTVDEAGKTAFEEIWVTVRVGAQSHRVARDVRITKGTCANDKAIELAARLDGATTELHINGAMRTVTVHAKQNQTTGNQIEITATYDGGTGTAYVEKPGFRNRTKQLEDRVTMDMGTASTAWVNLLGGSASGETWDGATSEVRVGTARGTASVAPSLGMLASEIRNLLVTRLNQIGIDASASGVQGLEIDLDGLDGTCVKFGITDSDIDIEGGLLSSE